MRLICPQCQTEYEVPDAALAGRARTLKCADCGTKFKAPALPAAAEVLPEPTLPEPEMAAAPESPEPPPPPPAPAPDAPFERPEKIIEPAPLAAARTAPMPAKPAQAKPAGAKPAQAGTNRALGISILIVVLIIAVVLVQHRQIAQAWPPSLRLFNALGLH